VSERWLPVIGFEGLYSVSNRGRVRREERIVTKDNHGTMTDHRFPRRIMKMSKIRGYWRVTLSRNGCSYYRQVHVLMLEAFRGQRPEGHYGLHNDDDKDRNVLSNLRWGTPSENSYDRVANGKDSKANQTKCSRGHDYTPENTMTRPDRPAHHRECRICHRENCRLAAARYRERKRLKQKAA
jgi:hypothetical protein